jgi:hypothetical protein
MANVLLILLYLGGRRFFLYEVSAQVIYFNQRCSWEDKGGWEMNTLITVCRDIEGPTSTDCIEDHEGVDVPLVAPCKVVRERCAPRGGGEFGGPSR